MKGFPDERPVLREPPWLVEGLWLRKGINVVYGFEKTGKSRLLGYALSQLLANPGGGPVLWRSDGNGPVVHHAGFRRVLYLNAEETDAAVQTRIWDYAASAGVTPNASWPLDVVEGLALGLNLYSAAERKDFVERFLAPGQYDVLVIDPLRNVHTGDEDSSTDMTPMYQAFRDWTSRYGITLILVHHTPKLYEGADLTRIATWSRGSTALPAILDWANMLRELNVYKTAGGTNREMSMLCKGRPSAEETYKLVDLGDPKGFRVTDL